MNLNKRYEEFKRFPLMIKLIFIPAIILGLAFVAAFVWLSVNNPFWLLSELITVLFVLCSVKLLFFFVADYPQIKRQLEEERLENLKPFE